MMTRLQYLLSKLAQEGNEAGHRALKAMEFGLGEIEPGQPLTNLQRIHGELNDLMTIIVILNTDYGFGFRTDAAHVERKILKVGTYEEYSRSLGQVE